MRIAVLFMSLAATALAGPCKVGTLQDYVNLDPDGCTIGPHGVRYQNFSIWSGRFGATEIDPALIQIIPIGAGPESGFEAAVDISASSGQVFESLFNFQVSGDLLQFVTLELSNTKVFGDAAVTSVADVCAGGFWSGPAIGCSGSPKSLVTVATADFAQLSDFQDPPTSFFDIFVDLDIDGGLSGGAHGSRTLLKITQTPEPASAGLLVLGGFVLAALRRQIRRGGVS